MPDNAGNPWEYNFYDGSDLIENDYDFSEIKKEYEDLLDFFEKQKYKITGEVLTAVENGQTDSKYWKDRLENINELYSEMVAYFAVFATNVIPQAFSQGSNLSVQMLLGSQFLSDYGLNSSVLERFNIAEIIDSPPFDPKVIDALIADSVAFMKKASDNGALNVKRLFRATQQSIIDEIKINESITKGLLEKNTTKSSTSAILQELKQKLGEGKFLEINGRKYQPEKYAEMLARTRIREAQTQGVLMGCKGSGVDLIRVSDHSTLTEICKQFEGRIFSISGKSSKYPALVALTPFHPNCLHVITPYIDVAEILGYNPYDTTDEAMAQVSEERRERLISNIMEFKSGQKSIPRKSRQPELIK